MPLTLFFKTAASGSQWVSVDTLVECLNRLGVLEVLLSAYVSYVRKQALNNCSFSWGDKFPAPRFLKITSGARKASPEDPLCLDIGKHFPTPGNIPVFIATDEYKGRIRQGEPVALCLAMCPLIANFGFIADSCTRREQLLEWRTTGIENQFAHLCYVQRRRGIRLFLHLPI
jgi:hypothetical protein